MILGFLIKKMNKQYQVYLTEQEISVILLMLRSKDTHITLKESELHVLERIKEYLKVVKRTSDIALLDYTGGV